MIARSLTLVVGALLLASCGQAPPADPAKPASYAVQLAAEPAAGDALQRLILPAAALAAMHSAGLADLRVFDARGKVLPMARADWSGEAAAERQLVTLPALAVIGSAKGAQAQAISLTIDDSKSARIVGLDTSIAGSKTEVVAVLLDTRALTEPAIFLKLGAELPRAQPVTFTVASSADLKSWEPIAEKVLFRDGGTSGVALPSPDLRGRYVRVSWDTDVPLASPLNITSATLTLSKLGQPQRITAATTGLEMIDARDLRFSLPFKAPLAGIRISQTAPDGPIPVRLYGRNDAEAPWIPLAGTTVRQTPNAGNLLELGDPVMAFYRITADSRTAGFSAAPRIELSFIPAELLVQFSGHPPYTLAAGLKDAPATYLTRAEIALGTQQLAAMPQAKMVGAAVPIVSLRPPTGGTFPDKRMILWLVLLAGAAVLGLALVKLLKGSAARGGDPA